MRVFADRAAALSALLAVTVVVLALADVQSPVRAVLTFVFVMIVPGWALLDCWGLAGGWLGAALVVATSTSLATVIATAQLYLGLWSPTGALVALAVVTVAAQTVTWWRRRQIVPGSLLAALSGARS